MFFLSATVPQSDIRTLKNKSKNFNFNFFFFATCTILCIASYFVCAAAKLRGNIDSKPTHSKKSTISSAS